MRVWHQPPGSLQQRGATPALLANYLGTPTITSDLDRLANHCWHYWVNSPFLANLPPVLPALPASLRNTANQHGSTPLAQAVLLGQVDLVQHWLATWPDDFTSPANSRLLLAAAWSGSNRLVELLLNLQSGTVSGHPASSPSLLTVAFNRLPDLGWEKLLEAGVDPNLLDRNQRNFLHCVADTGDFKSYEVVSGYGVDPDQLDSRGLTPQAVLANAIDRASTLKVAYRRHWDKLYRLQICF